MSNLRLPLMKIISTPLFTIVWENLLKIGSLVTRIQILEDNVCSILCDIKLFKRYEQYDKKFIIKAILVFHLSSVYQILSKSVHYVY